MDDPWDTLAIIPGISIEGNHEVNTNVISLSESPEAQIMGEIRGKQSAKTQQMAVAGLSLMGFNYPNKHVFVLPVMNLTGQFKVIVFGFNGELVDATVMLDSGCQSTAVIGQRLRKTAGIETSDTIGANFVFCIQKDEKKFFGKVTDKTACKEINPAKNSEFASTHVNVDILLGLPVLINMFDCGWLAGVDALVKDPFPEEPKYLPFFPSAKRFTLLINGRSVKCRVGIDSGILGDIAFVVFRSYYLNNSELFGNDNGNVDVELHDTEIGDFKFEKLSFVTVPDMHGFWSDVDIYFGLRFMELLYEKGIIVCP